jgi:hypothetical protein
MIPVHSALRHLSIVLELVGFKVVKKRARESTLRVYPVKLYHYPLLNPRFERGPIPGLRGRSFLKVWVFSKGDESLDARLRSFPQTATCVFIPGGWRQRTGYYCHGYFGVPLLFRGKSRNRQLDFVALAVSLTIIFTYLDRAA